MKEEELIKLRKESADWDFIKKQPLKIRTSLKIFIESGDLRLAQKFSGLSLEKFVDLLRKAKIWIT